MKITTPKRIKGEEEFEFTLRPKRLCEFIGQEKLKENLSVFLQAAKMRDEPLDHVLLSGPPGLGKTTLAYIIANELGTNITTTTGPAIEKPYDIAGILTKLNKKDVLFIDEIHRIGKVVEEYLYPAMEEYKIEIIIDKGPYARNLNLTIEPFTLIGATTRAGLISAPLRERFDINLRLNFYTPDELKLIVIRTSEILGIEIDEESAYEIAKRARGTPRIANRLVKRVKDFANIKNKNCIDIEITKYALEKIGIDEKGLDEFDREVLNTIIDKYNGGPVGIETIASSVKEDVEIIKEIVEPYLLQIGFIEITPKGRRVTPLVYEHLEKKSHSLF